MHDLHLLPSPAFVIEEKRLRKNLSLIRQVAIDSGAEIIMAFKGFAMWGVFPVILEYIRGAAASSLNEAKLCAGEMKTKAHTYCVAIIPEEAGELLSLSSHITFNSLSQFGTYGKEALDKGISCGLRVNPEYSEVKTPLYNPCSTDSRLGMTLAMLGDKLPEGIEGLHFHALCENDSYTLEKTLDAFEKKFSAYFPQLKWVNFGGGHLLTQQDYNKAHLVEIIQSFRLRTGLHVILEPGSAFAWQSGFLVSTILDLVENGGVKTAIMDISFTAHMPDCLEMPYRPAIRGASEPVKGKPCYRIGGLSCLAGDFMYEYAFDTELQIGDRLVFEDMIHYTMVKTNMFNGVKHPSIGMLDMNGNFQMFREFGYDDYKGRLS